MYGFGDAASRGSRSGIQLNAPIVAVAGTPDDDVFTFGDAQFHDSIGGIGPAKPIVGMG